MANFAKTPGWKKSSSFLYSVGAAIVMLGALAKLTHFSLYGVSMGNLLLTVGLITEAIIFFISAFEPIHQQYDWGLVYPELAGLDEERAKPLTSEGLDKLNNFFQNNNISNDTIENLGKGLNNLGDTASKLNDMSDASVATNEYVQNMKQAALSIQKFYEVNKHGIDSYTELSKMLGGDVDKIKTSINNYNDTLNNFNNSLSSLNEIYAKQLNVLNVRFENLNTFQQKIDLYFEEIDTSIENAKVFKDYTLRLSKNLESLNKIYSNMLSVLSSSK